MEFNLSESRFHIGQLVYHELSNYRGVICDVDPVFMLSDEWYDEVAKSRPPRDQPWYHVLVDGDEVETYVAERNLTPSPRPVPIDHPDLETHFDRFEQGRYWPRFYQN